MSSYDNLLSQLQNAAMQSAYANQLAQQQYAQTVYQGGQPMQIIPGQRIRINDRAGHGHQNSNIGNGIVRRIDMSYNPYSSMFLSPSSGIAYRVQFDNGYTNEFFDYELEIVTESVNATSDYKKTDNPIKLASVVMSDKKREQIHAAISQVENQKKIFKDWGFEEVFEKGTAVSLLFWGIPGTGKTLTAQAISDELKMKLKIYGTGEIESSEPGGAERNIQQIFEKAKGKKEIILLDECDSLLMDRNEVGPIIGAQINCLLTEIEKFDGIIIFTTNRLGKLDPALERRITAKVEFEFPNEEERRDIWNRMLPKKAPLDKDVNLDKLAEFPLAGGNIKNSVLNAARVAAYEGAKKITMKHFKDAIEKEAESLQAFISEYEDQNHSSMLSQVSRTSTGITLSKHDVAKVSGKDKVMKKEKVSDKKKVSGMDIMNNF